MSWDFKQLANIIFLKMCILESHAFLLVIPLNLGQLFALLVLAISINFLNLKSLSDKLPLSLPTPG